MQPFLRAGPLAVGYLLLLLFISDSLAAQTVAIANGTIQGVKCDRSNVTSFLAIPYAQPPIADLRYEPPRPYNSKFASNGILQATAAAPSCLQFGTGGGEKGPTSEDWYVAIPQAPHDISPPIDYLYINRSISILTHRGIPRGSRGS